MGTDLSEWIAHPMDVEEFSAVADTFEWDTTTPVTPLGLLSFFIEYLKQGGLFDDWLADCPLLHTSGIALRCGQPAAARYEQVVSEDALRGALAKIDETRGRAVVAGASQLLRPAAAPIAPTPGQHR